MWTCGLQLRVVEGAARGSILPLDAPLMKVGRSPGQGVRTVGWVYIKDDTVSSLHAELHWDEQLRRFRIFNRSQTNPTRVNEVEIEEADLQPGDQIRLGLCLLDLQQADMRFVGRLPEREHRAETRPMPPPPIAPLEPQISSPAAETTELKAPRALSLLARPSFMLDLVAGPNEGQQVLVRGNILAIGGAVDPAEEVGEKWYDQQLALGDRSLPLRCLALVWKEGAGAFELVGWDGLSVAVRVRRSEDNLLWEADLPVGQAGLLEPGDEVELGVNRFVVRLAEER